MKLPSLPSRRNGAPPWKTLAEGWAAGLAATAVMTQAQTRLLPRIPTGEAKRQPRFPSEYEARDENTPETIARRLVEDVARRELPEERKHLAGNLVHYGTGATLGMVLAALLPRPTIWQGALFGTAAWVINDNVLLPLLRVGDWPNRYPLGIHLQALGAHLVFGMAAACALRRGSELLEAR